MTSFFAIKQYYNSFTHICIYYFLMFTDIMPDTPPIMLVKIKSKIKLFPKIICPQNKENNRYVIMVVKKAITTPLTSPLLPRILSEQPKKIAMILINWLTALITLWLKSVNFSKPEKIKTPTKVIITAVKTAFNIPEKNSFTLSNIKNPTYSLLKSMQGIKIL